jgi:hypothetical protein
MTASRIAGSIARRRAGVNDGIAGRGRQDAVEAVGWGENRRGQAQGLAAGESRAKAECAYATKLSSWALTPDGVRAF